MIVQSSEVKNVIKKFVDTGISQDLDTINAANSFLCNILAETAKQANMTVKIGKPPKGRRGTSKPKGNKPKWFDISCSKAFSDIKKTSALLKKFPKNSFLKGKLSTETKFYKKLQKNKQGEFLTKLFSQLDEAQSSNPKAYWDLVKTIRTGTHDKGKPSDTDAIDFFFTCALYMAQKLYIF